MLCVADSRPEEDETYGLADDEGWTVSVTVYCFPGTDTTEVIVDFGASTDTVDGLA